jgi:hypothetical protein
MGSHNPKSCFLEPLKGRNKIGNSCKQHVFHGSGRSLGNSGGQRGSTGFGKNNTVDPHGQGGPDKGPKVLRIYNAVKCQNQRKPAIRFSLFEDCILVYQWEIANLGCDPLMH